VLRRRIAVASLVTLWCTLLAAMLGRYAWPLDLFSHFRVQYALLFLILAIVLFALRSPLLGAVFGEGETARKTDPYASSGLTASTMRNRLSSSARTL
jgi:endonuclease/exonuclease/phosphatase (EEP) superfamily protein YafD